MWTENHHQTKEGVKTLAVLIAICDVATRGDSVPRQKVTKAQATTVVGAVVVWGAILGSGFKIRSAGLLFVLWALTAQYPRCSRPGGSQVRRQRQSYGCYRFRHLHIIFFTGGHRARRKALVIQQFLCIGLCRLLSTHLRYGSTHTASFRDRACVVAHSVLGLCFRKPLL
jgi:hypothetical protein